MNPNKRQAIIEKLTYIATHTTDSSLYDSSSPPRMVLGIDDGWFISLVGEAAEAYHAVGNMLMSEALWKEKVSQGFINQGVHALLREIVKDRVNGKMDTIPAHLDAFLAECEQTSETYDVYLPLDNIQMAYDRLVFGKTTLVNMHSAQLEEHLQQFTAAIADPVERESILTHWQRDALPLLQNRVAAVYTISAEPGRAHELAEAEWYRFLDILRYFIFVTAKKTIYIDVGLRGDVRYGVGAAVLIPSTTHHIFQTTTTLKSPQPILIGPAVESAMRVYGVYALAELLKPAAKTAFSDTLFTGIHWVANALMQSEPANEYLSLVSCLETFLTRQRGDLVSIGNAVASGVGWVLGRDHSDRITLHKEVQDIYNKRSTISHGGKQEDIANLLPRLREIVAAFILQMVLRRDEFRTSGKQGLFDWVDLGPSRPEPPRPQA